MTIDKGTSVRTKAAAQQDSIEPKDFLPLFMRQWRWAVATFLIVAVIAIVSLSRIKPQWEAQGTIRVGQVYDALAGSARLVEPLQDVQERARIKSFLRDALKGVDVASAGLDADLENPLLLGVKIDPVPSTGLIRITARALTSDEATRAVRAIFDQLKLMHEELTRTAHSEVDLLSEQYTNELAGLHEVQSNLKKAFSSASNSGADDGSSAVASVASAMERNAREIREIDRQRFLLIRRDKYQSAPTEMIGKVSSVRIGGASRGLIIVFGIVMALAAGLVCALLRDYVGRRQSQLRSVKERAAGPG
jgi:capsular polysaccharide biosynthesis protein